ncbi:hypothetical protein GA0061098_106312 [Bradyrhizobium shewense]|uniref:Uncharacterized protein n=1 Tax=Bradyrhizobium shewense TaxID=1761772 RepID=A0A1C3XVC5_9BRAD|nr:hypothetical protein GA0061098_106312 [Bradyrhizobium shewense]
MAHRLVLLGCLAQFFGAAWCCDPTSRWDTVCSNTAAAYLDLPRALQRLADDLWAIHSFDRAARVNEAKDLADKALTATRFETSIPSYVSTLKPASVR